METTKIVYKAMIYCDGPYKDTTGYKNAGKKTDFDHDEFYEWIRLKVSENHIVLISEYQMPSDFVCIFEKEQTNNMSKNSGKVSKATEKLFIHESQLDIYKASYPDEV